MPRVRAVLFDADHTLLDTDRAERAALAAALRGLGLTYSPRVLLAYREINLVLWRAFQRGETDQPTLALERFRRLLAALAADPGRAEALSRDYLDALSGRGDLLPWCRRTLRWLRRRCRVGLVTNGIDRVQRSRLHAAGLDGAFEVVVTSESCGYAKPDPRILHVALEAMGVQGSEALYVGDDLRSDGEAARAAGIAFCWIPRGSSEEPAWPCHRLSHLRELASLVEPAAASGRRI